MSDELACFAVTESAYNGPGRRFAEKPHPYRTDFERDRDRIIHCSAFRRLEGKAQVFTPGLDDYYRTRLTHSIEVSQIGRTIAKGLRLNESLTEAICLAHDLGHSPFGHAGEKVLNDLMSEFGGFEHNRQTLRIVDLLEHPYPDFAGLNLMYETRLGLAKHRSLYDNPQGQEFKELNCSLEGQVADIADRIAYNCHDLEDGMRAGLISPPQIKIFTEAQSRINPPSRPATQMAGKRRINAGAIKDEAIRRTRTAKVIIDTLVSDCINASNLILDARCSMLDENPESRIESRIGGVAQIYNTSENLIVLSSEREDQLAELEEFLLHKFYQHKSLLRTADKVKKWLGRLFKNLCLKPDLMPGYFQRLAAQEGLQRTVCDYIAGMTDRFCLKMLEET